MSIGTNRSFDLGPIGLWVAADVEAPLLARLPHDWTIWSLDDDPTWAIARGDFAYDVLITDRLSPRGSAAHTARRPPPRVEPEPEAMAKVLGVVSIDQWVQGMDTGRVVWLPPHDPGDLILAVLDAGAERSIRPLVQRLVCDGDRHVWVRKIVKEALLTPVGTGASGREVAVGSADHLLATVEAWGVRTGVPTRTLRGYAQDAGVSIKAALMWIRAIRAIALYYPPIVRWRHVATRLGFADVSSLTTSIRMTLGVSPRRAALLGVNHWVARFGVWLEERWR